MNYANSDTENRLDLLFGRFSLSEYIFLVPIFGLFSVIYIDTKWFFIFIEILLKQPWLLPAVKLFLEKPPHNLVDQLISPVRGIVLILCLIALLVFLWKDIEWNDFRNISWPRWSTVLLGFLVFFLLFLPTGLHGMAQEYAETSLVLFQKVQPINRADRFLFPALANILFFRGPVFYYIFW